MDLEPIGEAAFMVRPSGVGGPAIGRVRALAEAIHGAAIPGVEDVVCAPGRVTIAFDPRRDADTRRLTDAVVEAARGAAAANAAAGTTHEMPVVYDGPDLDDLCAARGLDRSRFIALHTQPDYLVEAIGFLPGFGYLTGLPEELAAPRRATPRGRVPRGAVGIGGSQTGVYPFPSPGGWNLVGWSPVTLFDVTRSRPSLLAVGDRVRFVAADLQQTDRDEGRVATVADVQPRRAAITVLQPGLFTTVQDLGRRGHRAAGVPLSGAADGVSLRLANLLVGNPEDAAGIECTLLGPTLRFEREATVAVVGAGFPGFPAGQPVSLAAGTEISLGHATTGCRGVLAVAGGIDVPLVLGSHSTLVAAGLGGFAGRPLRAGDRLEVGEPVGTAKAMGEIPVGLSTVRRPCVLRVIPGEQAAECDPAIWSRPYRASSRSDRMGVRLDGEPISGAGAGGSMVSVAVFPGTVQLPPDGQPIILLADAQTIGGYPVVGHVIAADLPLAAQLRPGDELRLQPVSREEAHEALRRQEAVLAEVKAGLQ